jgi:hypothetical protein
VNYPVDSEEIVHQMQGAREHLGDAVDQVRRNARIMTDWRQHVKYYPWLSIGTAALVGYWLIPKRRRIPRFDRRAEAANPRPDHWSIPLEEPPRVRNRLVGALMKVAVAAASRGAITWFNWQIKQWLDRRAAPRQGPRAEDRINPNVAFRSAKGADVEK